MPELHKASIASLIVLGILLLLLVLFLAWRMRHHVMCECCLPSVDEVEAQEADSLMQVAQAVHSNTLASGHAKATSNHAVSRGFDHLPAYIAAKIAAKGRQRTAGSPCEPQQQGQHVEMALQSRKAWHQGGLKGPGQWHRLSSEDNNEALISTVPGETDLVSQRASPDLVLRTLSEQYSIASCSYPPLPWPDLGDPEGGLPLSSSSAIELIADGDGAEAESAIQEASSIV